jgi:hypothetical protein
MANFDPHMPEVDIIPNADAVFAKARELALKTDVNGQSPIAVTPGHQLLFPLGSVPPGTMSPENVQAIENLVP